jgi:hypothetical protein
MNQEKGELLYNMFFKRATNQPLEINAEYPELACTFSNITNTQVTKAINRLAPYKAPGPNRVANVIFTKCADLLASHLGTIFHTTFTQEHYPESWKLSSTIVLQKPGCPDYTLTKVYRPIALLDTMAKILSSCVADEIAYLAQTHKMLPPNHFGGCRG